MEVQDKLPKESFTGRQRRKKTRLGVRLADGFSRVLITVGGIGTIVAVLMVFFFLAWVVLPLFAPATAERTASFATPWATGGPVRVAIDEYQTVGWALYPDGRLTVFRASNGEVLEERQIFEDAKLTAASFSVGQADVAFGFADGTVRIGSIKFEPEFREAGDMPEDLHGLKSGDQAVFEKTVVLRTPIGQFRMQRLKVDLKDPVEVGDAAVSLIDHFQPAQTGSTAMGGEMTAVVFLADGKLKHCRFSENMFGGVTANTTDLPYRQRPGAGPPHFLLMPATTDNIYLAWKDGRVDRYNIRQPAEAKLVEQLDVLPDPKAELTAFQYLIGRTTILCGDSLGGLRGWFPVRQEIPSVSAKAEDREAAGDEVAAGDAATGQQPATAEGFVLTMAHELPAGDAAVTSLGMSERNRMVAAGYADGEMRVFFVTSAREVIGLQLDPPEPVTQVVMAPKDDGLLAATADQVVRWRFDPRHPEATLGALFLPVWYENYPEPIQMWQSSFAGVGPEMKLGLYPLIFGTIKATLYSMLFGAPLALLAAIYTSEFVHPTVRSKVKPTIEVMASLPSVVLGFLAALVFAPVVEKFVPSVLASFFVFPAVLLVGSFLWQLLPRRLELVLNRLGLRLVFVFLALVVGVVVSYLLGPLCEQWFFKGDVKRWLDDRSFGNGVGAWLLILFPLAVLAATFFVSGYVNPVLRQMSGHWTRFQFGLVNFAKFVLGGILAFLVAWGVAWVLTWWGWDPRGSYIATYGQRNALVVGFVMGFAIIPIIYTISEDALSTVPKHLRSASFGAGATPWQTATRVIIPTAMSGLFSALMVGLGRAVGETMIVLMAAGNTPVMDWNIFNGFRTLSANIAVELPEAVRDSTHYRTLFMAALVLFVMTFIVNTVAEVVRLRFRRRAYQL